MLRRLLRDPPSGIVASLGATEIQILRARAGGRPSDRAQISQEGREKQCEEQQKNQDRQSIRAIECNLRRHRNLLVTMVYACLVRT